MHKGTEHFVVNFIALILLAIGLDRLMPGHLVKIISLSSIGLGIILLLLPKVTYYCGLSGLLNTLLVVILMRLWRTSSSKIFINLLVLGYTSKLLYEMLGGHSVIGGLHWETLPEAHVTGAVLGLIYSLVNQWKATQEYSC